ncbi:hypothetical protein [Streptomyces wedmorensis]|uniref:hypothetical protein n=1 Tax=Streptomyces wedmorensis TaxID=43759 RepID=UPI0037A3280B
MADPLIPAARAAGSALQMVRAAASPYVMVKHGRREDRAAAYDRFIAACTAFYHDGEMDPADVNGLLAALLSIELRAPRHVRDAANDLFQQLVAVPAIAGKTGWVRELPEDLAVEEEKRVQGWMVPFEYTASGRRRHKVVTSSIELLTEIRAFADIARLDVTARWWHSLLTPWVKRWWLARK